MIPEPVLPARGTWDSAREADRQARRAAQTEFVRPLAVEAGAGTGKTTTLVARVLAWSLGPGWERAEGRLAPTPPARPAPDRIAAEVLGRVVAITFTEAAAAEMAGRVARDLAALAAGGGASWLDAAPLPPPEERVRRARALLGTLDHLVVRTIHAFCRGLIAAYPLEAGRHPALTVDADGRLLEAIVRETVETSLREAYGDPGDPDLLALAARGFGPPEIVEALLALAVAGLPAAALEEDPLGPEELAALHGRVVAACRAVHRLVEPRLAFRRGRRSNAHAVAEALAAFLGRIEAATPGATALGDLRPLITELLPPNLADRLGDWGKGRLRTDAEREALGDLLPELCPAAARLARLLDHLAALDPELLGQARRALAPLLARIERDLRVQGVETFNALLADAATLLAGHPEVRARVRRGIDQLLVDEFQDTDRLQCEILRWIALDGPAGERPGLFLVGDPKQSIYGWRSADLRAYDDFISGLREAGGVVRPLVENFRSVPAILAEVQRVVEPVMRERRGLQPRFEPLLPCAEKSASPGFRCDEPRPRRPVEHWVSWKEDEGDGAGKGRTRPGEATALEAGALAADLLDLHGRHGVPWREIGVLLRSLGDLDDYLEALRRARIPFFVGRDREYYRRREVIEAAALVRSVLDPGDHLALLTVLRSALVGVPDAALIPLWDRGFPRHLTELTAPRPEQLADLAGLVEDAARHLPEGIPGLAALCGWEQGLIAAVEHLAVLRRSFETDPADLFVEKLRLLFLPEAVAAARYLGAYRLANLDRFFRQLLAALEEGGGDGTAVLRLLRRGVAEAQEAEEGRPHEASEDAVSVLTIHGAKGLDFGHVYLLQLHKQSPGDRGPRTEVGPLPLPGLPGATRRPELRLFGAPTPGFDEVAAAREEVEAAERVRLLYVAMTRAKERLVLAALWPERGEPGDPGQARAMGDLLLARGALPNGSLFDCWQAGPAAAFDEADALWWFPGRIRAAEAEAGIDREGPALPGPAEVRRAAAELAAHRLKAERRMLRPFSGPASEEAHERLRELLAGRRYGDGTVGGEEERSEGGDSREAAMAAGGAVHRVLETWDLAADPRQEIERQRDLLPAYLSGLAAPATPADIARALRRARAVLDRFAEGPLLARLAGLRDHVLARELPVLLPPREDEGPVGAVAGSVDLLYRDPGTGDLVVADYKTDEVTAPDELTARAAAYAPQGAAYVRAVAEALDLPAPPRFEIWFLWPGRVVASVPGL